MRHWINLIGNRSQKLGAPNKKDEIQWSVKLMEEKQNKRLKLIDWNVYHAMSRLNLAQALVLSIFEPHAFDEAVQNSCVVYLKRGQSNSKLAESFQLLSCVVVVPLTPKNLIHWTLDCMSDVSANKKNISRACASFAQFKLNSCWEPQKKRLIEIVGWILNENVSSAWIIQLFSLGIWVQTAPLRTPVRMHQVGGERDWNKSSQPHLQTKHMSLNLKILLFCVAGLLVNLWKWSFSRMTFFHERIYYANRAVWNLNENLKCFATFMLNEIESKLWNGLQS